MEMTVTSVVRDSTGFVWLGNGLGVDRFDGVRLRHYPIEGNDMKYRRVNALAAIARAMAMVCGGWMKAPTASAPLSPIPRACAPSAS